MSTRENCPQQVKNPFKVRSTAPLFFYPMFHPGKDMMTRDKINSFIGNLQNPCVPSKKAEIYVHIPFCDSFCHMCACYKTHTPRDKSILARYVELLRREMDYYAGTPYVQALEIECVYFGGGTPSTLTRELIEELITHTKSRFNISGNKEITFEGDVRTLKDRDRLEALRRSGCNRVSFGVQTLNKTARKLSGLVPTLEEIKECIHTLRAYGYKINFDLMFGLPGQDMDIWKEDLQAAVELGVEGIDIYETIVYPTTKLFQLRHKRPMADGGQRMEMLSFAIEYLGTNSFVQKSKAIHEKDGNEFKLLQLGHESPDTVAIGDSAIGYLNNYAYRNVSPLTAYMNRGNHAPLPLRLGIELDKEDYYARRMLILPKILKISKSKYSEEIRHYRDKVNEMIDMNLIEEDAEYLKLTPLGKLWTDNIAYELIPSRKRGRMWKIMY
ncbi:MAG: coproporphyrinogen III oxidase family protein [Desulfobacteraceae bacterium]|nr:MAG: coproporphyrinogen III oxidase family protein [Desulfobacteraceae bacterium]